MRKIIYIHGFGSSGNSIKGGILKEYFGVNVITPSLKSHPENDIKELLRLIENENNPLLVGSSLGGFYGEYLSITMGLDAILINPLSDVSLIKNYIGINTYYENGLDFNFTIEDYRYLELLSESIKSFNLGSEYRSILLAKDDDTIPYNISVNHFNRKNESVYLWDNGGHGFNEKDRIIKSINALL